MNIKRKIEKYLDEFQDACEKYAYLESNDMEEHNRFIDRISNKRRKITRLVNSLAFQRNQHE